MHTFVQSQSRLQMWGARAATASLLAALAFGAVYNTAYSAPVLAADAKKAAPSTNTPDRSKAPAVGKPASFAIPEPKQFKLKNGIAVYVLPRHSVPMVDIHLIIDAGPMLDPSDKYGLAFWTAQMLSEGAAGKSSLDFADAVSFLGARLGTFAVGNRAEVRLHTATSHLHDALSLMRDAVVKPNFAADDWARMREQATASFAEMRGNPNEIFGALWQRTVYGENHRMGVASEGNYASFQKITLDDIKQFHKDFYRPDSARLIVAGDVNEKELQKMLDEVFADWQAPKKAKPTPPPVPSIPKRERTVWMVDVDGAAQSKIAAVSWLPSSYQEYSAADSTMHTLLGGSFTSRLNQNLRERNQYSYGARASLETMIGGGGSFSAESSVATDVTAPALREIDNELKAIQVPPTEEETVRARQYLALSFPSAFATNDAVADVWNEILRKQIPVANVKSFSKNVLKVTAKDIATAGKRDVDLAQMQYLVVGDLDVVRASVEAQKLAPTRVLTIDELFGPAPKEEQ